MALGRRWTWLAVLGVGLLLYFLVLSTLVATQNPNLVPVMLLLGATVIPAAFVTFMANRAPTWQVSAPTLAAFALFGGVLGAVMAGLLEYNTLRHLQWFPALLVAVIEEAVKLAIPAAVLFTRWLGRPGRMADGLVVGAATGAGFAALETMGYAFVVLLDSKGDVGAVEVTLFLRGLLASAAHLAWTGVAGAALWRVYLHGGRTRLISLIAAFIGVVALHTIWNAVPGPLTFVVVAAVSIGWLLWELHRSRTPEEA
ncbi:PrsW family glutamic-type intramembrane protease [Micromonospora pattaloongensis]|nr:PrsW family glutamic-type intramembrane protease [Micromonospora pattaloongensis]